MSCVSANLHLPWGEQSLGCVSGYQVLFIKNTSEQHPLRLGAVQGPDIFPGLCGKGLGFLDWVLKFPQMWDRQVTW